MPFLTNEIRPSVFLMQKEEEPQEPQANYCFQIDFKNEPTNAFFRTFMGIINHQLSSSKCTLLETTVVKNIEPKEEIKESDLAIEIIEGTSRAQKVSPHLLINQKLSYPKKEETTKNDINSFIKKEEKAFFVQTGKCFQKEFQEIPRIQPKLSQNSKIGRLGRNFPKILGQAVIKFIKEQLFSDKLAVQNIYDEHGLQEQKPMAHFLEWINSIYCQYTSFSMLRKVWLQNFERQKERNFAEVLTELTSLFLHQESYYYLIKNSGRFRNPFAVEEYMKCIPIFIQGVNHPLNFTGLPDFMSEKK